MFIARYEDPTVGAATIDFHEKCVKLLSKYNDRFAFVVLFSIRNHFSRMDILSYDLYIISIRCSF